MSEIGRKVKERYQVPKTAASREKTALEYMPLVQKIASRLSVALPPSLEMEDLIGCGMIGLLEAWDRFDPSRGVAFASFAAWRIKGAMVDELRRVTPAPRSLFDRFRQMDQVSESLRQKLHREPDQFEIAAALGWSPSVVEQLWASYNLLSLVSLDALLFSPQGEENVPPVEFKAGAAETPETVALKSEQRRMLAAALGMISDREKTVLSLYYLEELTQKEIAGLLKISTGRVSQLHAQAIRRLREILSA